MTTVAIIVLAGALAAAVAALVWAMRHAATVTDKLVSINNDRWRVAMDLTKVRAELGGADEDLATFARRVADLESQLAAARAEADAERTRSRELAIHLADIDPAGAADLLGDELDRLLSAPGAGGAGTSAAPAPGAGASVRPAESASVAGHHD